MGRKVEPPLDLAIGILGKTDPSRLANAFQSRGDVDPVAHQIAVALLHHVAEVDANAELDAPVRRDLSVALDHRRLDFKGAADGVYHAAEFDDAAVAGALDDAAMMHGDCGINQIAAQRAQSRKCPVLVGSGKPRIADDVGH